ncbi:hypothetical protein QBC47DRAFT_412888 [Echria macrotheca]|uniref:Uncharacterized protein n=1 Tax=Echria macrotheca TaxID=438768 RepID=A0AAJ0BFT9_9PEZI|nr:hypothetical protein QBC47DRAFT_412888 [Echria macrotheca]
MDAIASLELAKSRAEFRRLTVSTCPTIREDEVGRSGIVCAILVLRHLVQCLPRSMKAILLEFKPTSPLLQAALDPDPAQALQKAQDAAHPAIRFEDIIENDEMHDGIWKHGGFFLYCPLLGSAGSVPWRSVTEASLLRLSGEIEGPDLAQAISRACEQQKAMVNGYLYLKPYLLRVRCDDLPDRKDFNPYRFTIGVFRDYELDGDRIVSEKILEPQDYICMAIVQLGDSANADRLILKDFSGMPLFLTERRSDLPWILGPRKRGPYMLYFIKDPEFPNRGPAPTSPLVNEGAISHDVEPNAEDDELVPEANAEDGEVPNEAEEPSSSEPSENVFSSRSLEIIQNICRGWVATGDDQLHDEANTENGDEENWHERGDV